MLLVFLLIYTEFKIKDTVTPCFEEPLNPVVAIAEEQHADGPDKKFDCSGFVQYCYKKADIKIPRSSMDQYSQGLRIEREDTKPGDLIFFTGSNSSRRIPGHVGIVRSIVNDSISFIHVSSSVGITINSLHEPYYEKRFLGLRRVET